MIISNATHLAAHEPVALVCPPPRAEPNGLIRRWLARRNERRTLCELKDLPPYLLEDIGLLQYAHPSQQD